MMKTAFLLLALLYVIISSGPLGASQVIKARIWAAADDEAQFYLNGKEILSVHYDKSKVVSREIDPAFFTDSNILAILNRNTVAGGHAVSYVMEVALADGKSMYFSSEDQGHSIYQMKDWRKSRDRPAESWRDRQYNDTAWKGTVYLVYNIPVLFPTYPQTRRTVPAISGYPGGEVQDGKIWPQKSYGAVYLRRIINLWQAPVLTAVISEPTTAIYATATFSPTRVETRIAPTLTPSHTQAFLTPIASSTATPILSAVRISAVSIPLAPAVVFAPTPGPTGVPPRLTLVRTAVTLPVIVFKSASAEGRIKIEQALSFRYDEADMRNFTFMIRWGVPSYLKNGFKVNAKLPLLLEFKTASHGPVYRKESHELEWEIKGPLEKQKSGEFFYTLKIDKNKIPANKNIAVKSQSAAYYEYDGDPVYAVSNELVTAINP